MRRAIVVGALTALSLVGPAPAALAAPPEITPEACEEAGGTFTRERGVKTCTTTTVFERTSVVDSTPYNWSYTLEGYELWNIDYTGTSFLTEWVQTTTIRSQKGNGEITTESTSTVLSSNLNRLSCRVDGHYLGASFGRYVHVQFCDNPEMYAPGSFV